MVSPAVPFLALLLFRGGGDGSNRTGETRVFDKTKARIETKITEPVQHAYVFAITAFVIACLALLAVIRNAH